MSREAEAIEMHLQHGYGDHFLQRVWHGWLAEGVLEHP
jgi:hypothetical protein